MARILFVNVPSRAKDTFVPLGPLYAAGAVMREGHKAAIHDLNRGTENDLFTRIKDFDPDVVGFSGIGSSYGNTKRLALHLKNSLPGVIQIAGSALACTFEYLLKNTPIDLVFHGESELSLPMFLKIVDEGGGKEHLSFTMIPGTSNRVRRNPPAGQIADLDTIPFPPYELIHPPSYGGMFPIMTSRGCTNRCLFCYRHMQGYRQHSVPYVRNHIEHLMKEYGMAAFNIGDELFNRDKRWVMDFCDAVENLGITYTIAGARVRPMDDEMLHRLKETGCQSIAYGQESGSDAILHEYRKGATAAENREITIRTKAHEIACPIQLVIGAPGETRATIDETIRFIRDVGGSPEISVNYLIPFPETPVWTEGFVRKIGDVERYLDDVARYGGAPLVNLTDVPDRVWKSWAYLLKTEGKIATKGYGGVTTAWCRVCERLYQLLPEGIVRAARRISYRG